MTNFRDRESLYGMEPNLTPYEQWAVRQNVEYAKTEGVAAVVAHLRAYGYDRIAAGVEAQTGG